jgi:anti-sigma factor (TIGR02949 family)
MNCIDVAKSMQLFLDEELPFQQVETVQLHVASCSVCQEKLKAEQVFKQVLKERISRKTATDTILDEVRMAVNAHAIA